MSKISSGTRSNGSGSVESQNRAVGNLDTRFELIKEANRKVRLIEVLRAYNIRITRNGQRAWSENIVCPLPSHKKGNERTASFGYNYIQDLFHCQGCKKSGKSVEFISEMESRTRTSIAKEILERRSGVAAYEGIEPVADNITPQLLEFSGFLNKLIQKYKNDKENLAFIEKLIWYTDVYMFTKGKFLEQEGLESRIKRVKELLNELF